MSPKYRRKYVKSCGALCTYVPMVLKGLNRCLKKFSIESRT